MSMTIDKQLPRVLLLSATPPGSSGVGQLFLSELCRSYPEDRLSLAIVTQNYRDSDREQFSHLPVLHLSFVESDSRGPGPAWLDLARRHMRFRRQRFEDRGCLSQLIRFCEAQRPNLIWAVLNSPRIMRLVPRLVRATGLPVVTTVWDPPQGVGRQFGLDRISRRLVERDFAAAMKQCNRCGVISERMEAKYEEAFGVECLISRHGISPVDQLPHSHDRDDESELHIGFCGSLYAEREWQSFVRGLDVAGWRVGDRRIRVTVIGKGSPALAASVPAHFEFLGWRNMYEVVNRLSHCHFNYLPYWFHPAYTDSVALCFPTKLTTYLTAGRPVLYHGPRDASVVDFFQRFGIGRCCHSLDPHNVAESVKALSSLSSRDYDKLLSGVQSAVREELNLDVFRRRFFELIVGSAEARNILSSKDRLVAS